MGERDHHRRGEGTTLVTWEEAREEPVPKQFWEGFQCLFCERSSLFPSPLLLPQSRSRSLPVLTWGRVWIGSSKSLQP